MPMVGRKRGGAPGTCGLFSRKSSGGAAGICGWVSRVSPGGGAGSYEVAGGSSAGCDCGVDTVDPSNADFQGKIAAGKHRPAMIMLLSAACAGNGVALLPAPLRRSVVRGEGIRWNCLAFRWHARSMDATGVATRRNLTIFSRIEKPSRRELMVKRL